MFLLLAAAATGRQALAQQVLTEPALDRGAVMGARGAAMADDYVSETYEVSGMLTNPSALGFLERYALLADVFLNPDGDYSRESIALPFRLDDRWVLGVRAYLENAADRSTERLPLKFWEYGVDVAVAHNLVRFVSAGVGLSVRNASPQDGSSLSGTWSFGFTYAPFTRLTYAVAYRGGREGYQYEYDPAATSTRMVLAPMTHDLSVGLSLRLPDRRTQRHFLAFSLEGDYRFYGPQEGTIFSGGLELYVFPFLAVRSGYKTGRDVETARYGAGLRFDGFSFDYAISPSRAEPRFHQFSLLIDLGG
jgi:hypothetical protein